MARIQLAEYEDNATVSVEQEGQDIYELTVTKAGSDQVTVRLGPREAEHLRGLLWISPRDPTKLQRP